MSQKQLLVRLPNWIGDVIMALPAIDALRSHGINPILIGRPWVHDLLDGRSLTCISWPKTLTAGVKLLKQQPCQDMLLFPNSFSSALSAKLAQKKVIAYEGDGRKFLLNTRLKKPLYTHESHIFFALSVETLHHWYDIEHNQPYQTPSLQIHPDTLKTAQTLLKAHQILDNYIVLCPFAHGMNHLGQPKKWPYWQRLEKELSHMTCVICPSPAEWEQAVQCFPNSILLKDVPLNTYAGLLSMASAVIANDSGPMHIASAVGARTIAIFGATDPLRAAPANAEILGTKSKWPSVKAVLNQLYRL